MTLDELTKKAERAKWISAQLAEMEKTVLSPMDRIRWFTGGGNIDSDLETSMVHRAYVIISAELRAELDTLLRDERKDGDE